MFGEPFYHETTKRVVSAFGMMFNNINITRENENAVEVSRMKIPLKYHAKKAWHSILREHSDRDEELISLQGYFPRLSYYLSDIQYLPDKKLQQKTIVRQDANGNMQTYRLQTPYRLFFELTVVTKKQNDLYRIIEQIIPYFDPSLSVSIKPSRVFTTDVLRDFDLTLQSVTIDDELEIDFESAYNLQLYVRTLNFTTDIYYYGPVASSSGVIKTATTTFYEGTTGKAMSAVEVEIDPPDAEAISFGISCGSWNLDDDFNLNTSGILDC